MAMTANLGLRWTIPTRENPVNIMRAGATHSQRSPIHVVIVRYKLLATSHWQEGWRQGGDKPWEGWNSEAINKQDEGKGMKSHDKGTNHVLLQSVVNGVPWQDHKVRVATKWHGEGKCPRVHVGQVQCCFKGERSTCWASLLGGYLYRNALFVGKEQESHN